MLTAIVGAANGSLPHVALDNHGQAQVTWEERSGSTNLLHACQLPPGALACAHDSVPAQHGRTSVPLLPDPADGQRVDVVVGDFPDNSGAAGTIASSDGGASYGHPYPVGRFDPFVGGLVFPSVVAMGPGQIAFSGLERNLFEAAPLDGSATPTAVELAPSSQTEGVRAMGIGFLDATMPLLVWDHYRANPDGTSQDTIGYRRWMGTGSINDTSTWAPWSGPGSLNDAATWGPFKDFSPPDGMTSGGDYLAGRVTSGPKGVFAIYFPKVAQPGARCGQVPEIVHYNPSVDSWEAPLPVDNNPHTDLTRCSYGDGFSSSNPLKITEDAAGILHVLYSFNSGHPSADDSPAQGTLYTVSVDGGRTFAPPVSIASPDDTLGETHLAVNAGGDARLAFSQTGGAIKVMTLLPLSAFFPPVTTITSGPAEGSTVYPCRSCAGGLGPVFTFTSSVAGARFECRTYTNRDLIGLFEPCSSPYRANIAPGDGYTFTVSAIGPTGVSDQTPPHRMFRYTSQLAEYELRAAATLEEYACLHHGGGSVGEDQAVALEGLLWAVRKHGRNYRCPGQELSLRIVNDRLRTLRPWPVGTSADNVVCHTEFDYDAVLKSLVPIAYRYADLLSPEVRRHLVSDLLTQRGRAADGVFYGCADKQLPAAVIHLLVPLIPGLNLLPPGLLAARVHELLKVPETENHVLMIESSRYLTNQLLFDAHHERRYDNRENGMNVWMLRHLQQFAQHDFLEYNARAYQRYSINALLNLYDYARDKRVRTAAQIVLDYVTSKFGATSNMLRRAGPFRRLKGHTDAANGSYFAGGSDPQTAFFELYAGFPRFPTMLDPHGDLFPLVTYRLPPHISEPVAATIGALSTYLPPQDAISLATDKSVAYRETFVHGARPKLPRGEKADGGVEIYASSRSFLLTAGGVWLNSGYGHDELDGSQVGNKQSTTLMPTLAKVDYGDLVRFDGFGPDTRDGNLCVARNFACGVYVHVGKRLAGCPGSKGYVVGNLTWQFLDLNNPTSPPRCRLGFYVALHTEFAPRAGNFGYLSAIEGSAMSFTEFMRRTRSHPGNDNLSLRQLNTFTSAEGHTYRFHVVQPGGKYDQMVSSVDGHREPSAAGGLATGPYIRSVGHTGYLEVRSPLCGPDPIVLDYRDALNPVRRSGSSCHEWLAP
jgi:hypothetical protein